MLVSYCSLGKVMPAGFDPHMQKLVGSKPNCRGRWVASSSIASTPTRNIRTPFRPALPSGRIVRLDVSKAARMPGVRAVVTAADALGKIGIGIADHPLFARDLIRYDGEPLAAIAADTLIQAKAALAAIDVEVAPLPAVLTMAEALAPEAPLVHPDWREHEILLAGGAREGNIAWEATVVRGDVDAAFARPDAVIVDSAFRVGRQNHVAFEPRAVVASYALARGGYDRREWPGVGGKGWDRSARKALARCRS